MSQNSSWDKLREKSKYHFDTTRVDNKKDVLYELGRIEADYSEEIKQIVSQSKPANWETRGFKGEGVQVPKPELAAEEFAAVLKKAEARFAALAKVEKRHAEAYQQVLGGL